VIKPVFNISLGSEWFEFDTVGWVTGRMSGHKNLCHLSRVATNLEKPGILWEFSEPGKLREFCAASGKNYNK